MPIIPWWRALSGLFCWLIAYPRGACPGLALNRPVGARPSSPFGVRFMERGPLPKRTRIWTVNHGWAASPSLNLTPTPTPNLPSSSQAAPIRTKLLPIRIKRRITIKNPACLQYALECGHRRQSFRQSFRRRKGAGASENSKFHCVSLARGVHGAADGVGVGAEVAETGTLLVGGFEQSRKHIPGPGEQRCDPEDRSVGEVSLLNLWP